MSKSNKTTKRLLKKVIQCGEDYEWYPTTEEIISAMLKHVRAVRDRDCSRFRRDNEESILDIGAGNGKVLTRFYEEFKGADLYAIEKSHQLIQSMPGNIFVIGTDFHEQTLFDKEVSVVFCNPPYSEYSQWATKIIREMNSPDIYLVIPSRWKENVQIEQAIKFREFAVEVVGEFDFQNAEDRTARCKVDLVHIGNRFDTYERPTGKGGTHDHTFRKKSKDPFDAFFRETFSQMYDRWEASNKEEMEEASANDHKELVDRGDFVHALVKLYIAETARIQKNYEALNTLDVSLMKEFDIKPDKVMELLAEKIKNLKKRYWKILFDNLETITGKLTSKTRQKLLSVLFANTQVDFTVGNAYAIIVWAIKQANDYVDSQLIDTYEDLVSASNCVAYKSNVKLLTNETWRYRWKEQNSHYKLETRLVVSCGGINTRWSGEVNGLDENAANLLSDLCTVARNLGFEPGEGYLSTIKDREWYSKKGRDIWLVDRDGNEEVLMRVSAFLNGNCHIKLNQQFALALNVEFGRLKGWINNASEAAVELDDPEAVDYFESNLKIEMKDTGLRLGTSQKPEPEPKVKAETKPAKPKAKVKKKQPATKKQASTKGKLSKIVLKVKAPVLRATGFVPDGEDAEGFRKQFLAWYETHGDGDAKNIQQLLRRYLKNRG